MPGKIVSKAQQGYLAVHKPAVLHELSGGHIPNAKSLPYHVKSGGMGAGRSGGPLSRMFGKGKKS